MPFSSGNDGRFVDEVVDFLETSDPPGEYSGSFSDFRNGICQQVEFKQKQERQAIFVENKRAWNEARANGQKPPKEKKPKETPIPWMYSGSDKTFRETLKKNATEISRRGYEVTWVTDDILQIAPNK